MGTTAESGDRLLMHMTGVTAVAAGKVNYNVKITTAFKFDDVDELRGFENLVAARWHGFDARQRDECNIWL